MALRLKEIYLTLAEGEELLPAKIAQAMGVEAAALGEVRIVRRGIDARQKPRVRRVYTVEFTIADEERLLRRQQGNHRLERALPPILPEIAPVTRGGRSLVVGMGPAGLFAAWFLARSGVDVVLVERGRPVETRVRDVESFWRGEGFNPSSNVQFGEGGAGTFSDGKLTTRLNHPWMRLVLQILVDFGAPEDILVQAKPHVGTDRLRAVIIRFRQALQSLGVEVRFESRLSALLVGNRQVRGGVLNDRDEILCDHLILAPGHSARDTYGMLREAGVTLAAKPFAMGVRIEHPAAHINRIQYGMSDHPLLPAAEYVLSYNDPESGRGIYSFCMCPGGEVVTAPSEPGGMVVNGMSYRDRSGPFSNSALVVGVRPDDFGADDPLAGMHFQRRFEETAFVSGGGDYRAPAQNLLTFLGRGRGGINAGTCRPGIKEADLHSLLPPFVSTGLKRALPHFNRTMPGFITGEAMLIGVETRTSAPLRIVRGEDGQSVSHPGLYPAGEGAGYAGGIMSAALDGLLTAQRVVQGLHPAATNIQPQE
jgi:uncharacterized protein